MTIGELASRYTPAQRKVIDSYFSILKSTRKTGKIATSVIIREMEYWSKFPPEVVVDALSIHIKKYPNKKEAYTRGIMRELMRERGGTGGNNNTKPARSYGKGKYRSRYFDGNSEHDMPF